MLRLDVVEHRARQAALRILAERSSALSNRAQ
jgi:hypothetical protein